MNVIKRNGEEVVFDPRKILNAINAVNKDVSSVNAVDSTAVWRIANEVVERCVKFNRAVDVEDIQDIVEQEIAKAGYFEACKQYMLYRYKRALARQKNTTDDEILTILDGVNETVKQENSNKNPTVLSVQRDYLAGTVSKDIVRRYMFPKEVMTAHDSGLIHIHDCDYISAKIHNCDLVNLEDMLQNGTVISGTHIDKPKSFLTACNIATQIVAQVASSQFGGQSISLSHLAPFVDISRQKIRTSVYNELNGCGLSDDKLEEIVAKRLKAEIAAGIQTIQYQILTLQTTNGQTPFVTVFMYLGEVSDPRTKEDLAMIIEETLRQRLIGVKNEAGVYVTPAFPKLIMVLEEDNIHETSKYWYLTELAAKCTAKRMVPDYISEKIMKQIKKDEDGNGYCYPMMGCRSALTVWRDENKKAKFYGRLTNG